MQDRANLNITSCHSDDEKRGEKGKPIFIQHLPAGSNTPQEGAGFTKSSLILS
jgi:hypothetical protein